MNQQSPQRPIFYLSVAISDDGVAETSGSAQVLYIPKGGIIAMELTSGIAAERPVLQAIAAATFILIGLFGVALLSFWITEGGLFINYYIYLLFGFPVGLWFLYGLIRKRTYLLTTTSRGTRKLVFKGRIDHEELAEFIDAARHDFGYPITSSIPEVI